MWRGGGGKIKILLMGSDSLDLQARANRMREAWSMGLGLRHTGSPFGKGFKSAVSSHALCSGCLCKSEIIKFPFAHPWLVLSARRLGFFREKLFCSVRCTMPCTVLSRFQNGYISVTTLYAWCWIQFGSVIYHNFVGWKGVSPDFFLLEDRDFD